MDFVDRLDPPKGHLTLVVHDGNPEREPLTPEQVRENEVFRLANPEAPYPLHVGRIVSRPIDIYEFDNVVTTVGKRLLLDRWFGITATALNSTGVGATAAAAAVGDTQIGSTPAIKAFDALPIRTGSVVNSVTTFLDTEANIAWNEAGLLNGTVNGTSILGNRVAPIGPFTKTAAVAIEAKMAMTQG